MSLPLLLYHLLIICLMTLTVDKRNEDSERGGEGTTEEGIGDLLGSS